MKKEPMALSFSTNVKSTFPISLVSCTSIFITSLDLYVQNDAMLNIVNIAPVIAAPIILNATY